MPGLGYELRVPDTVLWCKALAGRWGGQCAAGRLGEVMPGLKILVQAPMGALVCQVVIGIFIFNSLLLLPSRSASCLCPIEDVNGASGWRSILKVMCLWVPGPGFGC